MQRTISSLDSLLRDVRFAFRLLQRKPAFYSVVILVLGLGIGANTAMFSIVHAVLLKPLPYRNSERLVLVCQSSAQHRATGEWFDTYSEFQQWQSNNRSFEKLAALSWAVAPKSLAWRGKKQKILAIPASVDFFTMLGVTAQEGRTFAPADLNQGCTVVLSHSFWQNDLGAPADLPGRSLRIDQAECRVAGIMPKGFSFYPVQTSLWTLITPDSQYEKDSWRAVTGVFGLLKPGVSRNAAESELEILQRNIMPQAPAGLVLPRSAVPVALDLRSEFTWLAGRNLRRGLIVLLATVFAVLLIACVNVANLLLAQAAERQRELAIRTSLGCGRGRLIRLLLVECTVLSCAGAVAGTLMAVLAVQLFRANPPVELPPGSTVELNWQVLAFTILLAALSAVLFGLAPAWRASRPDLNLALKEAGGNLSSGKGARRMRSVLVVAEVGLSLILTAGAGLLLESLARLAATPLGFRTDHLLTGTVALPDDKYGDPDQKVRFLGDLKERIGTLPGVQGVSLSSSFYLNGSNVLSVENRAFDPASAAHDVAEQTVDESFLATMGVPLLQGRGFDSRDRRDSAPTAVINQALADHYFPDQNPVGRQIKLGAPESNQPWLTVAGVVGNVKTTTVFQEMGYIVVPAVYRPLEQQPLASMSLLVRTHGEPGAIANTVRQKLQALDESVTLSDLKTMQERLSDLQTQPRFRTVLLSAFAALALLLAALGIYGLLMQWVVGRTKEIGIRMALGASKGKVVHGILRQTLSTVVAGIFLGLVATMFLVRFIEGLLYEVRPGNPLVLAGVSALLVLVALAASYFPARRAADIDPLAALRTE